MLIYAIGIYEHLPSGEFSKIQSAQKYEGFFAGNDLKKLEEQSLSKHPDNHQDNIIYHTQPDPNEHHYIVSRNGVFAAISSRGTLEQSECYYLFTNIFHIYFRSTHIKTTLKDIITNPIGYIGHDILLKHTQQEIEQVKLIMLNNIDKVLTRGEQIESLMNKTEKLEINTVTFKKAAENLNRYWCCRS